MTRIVYIDGDQGTTGLRIVQRLRGRQDITLRLLPDDQRKDPLRRAEALNACDVAILCLPDAAAREAVGWIQNPQVRVIDASSAHRTDPGWVYGLPELCEGQAQAVAQAERVANPGCYATGAIALLRPLIDAGLLAPDMPVSLPSVSGYSGGGRPMIEAYEAGQAPLFETYALGLSHKHIPEIMRCTGLTARPLFIPSVGNFRQGMLVNLPLHLDSLPTRPSGADLHAAYVAHYARSNTPGQYVQVLEPTADGKLDATALADTNQLEIRVYANEATRQAVAIARLDNLGKGASGAAVQNLQLMLGL